MCCRIDMLFCFLSCRQSEMDEAVSALKEKYDREKYLLTEENRKLTTETDKVTKAVSSCIPNIAEVILLVM